MYGVFPSVFKLVKACHHFIHKTFIQKEMKVEYIVVLVIHIFKSFRNRFKIPMALLESLLPAVIVVNLN